MGRAGVFPNTIEVDTYEALKRMGVAFEPQKSIGLYVVDAYLPGTNTVIEVQGDYWHANPDGKYGDAKYAMQRKTVARDKRKFAYLRNRDYRIVELWEKDIRAGGAEALLREALNL